MTYEEKCRQIMTEYKEEIHRIFQYPFCDLEFDFLGFLDSYEVTLPKDFTVIDFGCYQAVQSIYFSEQKQYIGVDIAIPNEWRMRAYDNAVYYQVTIQDFIQNILPTLHLDLEKVFAISSYVPDNKARELVRNTFPYFRDIYCDEKIENLPEEQTLNDAKEDIEL